MYFYFYFSLINLYLQVIVVARNTAWELSSSDGQTVKKVEIPELKSNQEETDTRVIIYASYGATNGYGSIRVKSPDSDIFFILLNHAFKIGGDIYFDTGVGNKKRLLNVSDISSNFGESLCSALLGLHAFSGSDTTSAFKGIGKLKPIKLLQKYPEFETPFRKLGESWDISETDLKEIESFTCKLYGKVTTTNIDTLRLNLLKIKCDSQDKVDPKKSVDLASFPPCRASLDQHLRRCNYQAAIWRKSNENFQELPPATDHGWVNCGEVMEPQWCLGEVLPGDLSELLEDSDESGSDNDVLSDIEDNSEDSDYDFS